MTNASVATQAQTDPLKSFWNGLWLLISLVSAVPLFVDVAVRPVMPYAALLAIHELSGFMFFGHTLFSNVWCMRVRQTQNQEAKLWAHHFIRKLALGITLPTSIITPLAGLMLIDAWGGLRMNPWAWEAYLCFWIMAAMQLTPDIITVWRNRERRHNPNHKMMGGAIRGVLSTVLTLYIIICMSTKSALIAPYFL